MEDKGQESPDIKEDDEGNWHAQQDAEATHDIKEDEEGNWHARGDLDAAHGILLDIYNAMPGSKEWLRAWERQELLLWIQRTIEEYFKTTGLVLEKWPSHRSSLQDFQPSP